MVKHIFYLRKWEERERGGKGNRWETKTNEEEEKRRDGCETQVTLTSPYLSLALISLSLSLYPPLHPISRSLSLAHHLPCLLKSNRGKSPSPSLYFLVSALPYKSTPPRWLKILAQECEKSSNQTPAFSFSFYQNHFTSSFLRS